MPGPKPKYSPEERKKQGNPGKRPADVKPATNAPADLFPEPPVSAPAPPAFLTSPDSETNRKAADIWAYLAEYVFAAKLFRDGDAAALGRLCRYLAEWQILTETLDVEGFVISASQGKQRHPALLARNNIEPQIVKLEAQFGLNPEDRLALTKDFANSLKNLPLAGKSNGPDKPEGRGPVGFLKKVPT